MPRSTCTKLQSSGRGPPGAEPAGRQGTLRSGPGQEAVQGGPVAEDLEVVGGSSTHHGLEHVRRRAPDRDVTFGVDRLDLGPSGVSRTSHSPSPSVQCRCMVSPVPVIGGAPKRFGSGASHSSIPSTARARAPPSMARSPARRRRGALRSRGPGGVARTRRCRRGPHVHAGASAGWSKTSRTRAEPDWNPGDRASRSGRQGKSWGENEGVGLHARRGPAVGATHVAEQLGDVPVGTRRDRGVERGAFGGGDEVVRLGADRVSILVGGEERHRREPMTAPGRRRVAPGPSRGR